METGEKFSRTRRNISAIMRKVPSINTAPEVKLRKALWSQGLRYKICPKNLAGKPDIILPSIRLAIFIDGDLWHGNQWRRRGLLALEDQFLKSNSKAYWLKKIRRNMQRDCVVTSTLISEGWTVLRFWESDINQNLENCVKTVMEIIKGKEPPTSLSIVPDKTFAEFFAGIGLMRMGLERQGWSVSFANDIDPQKYEMYKGNFSDADKHFVLGDIHRISADQVPSVTLATASFPCNDLSLAGARGGIRTGQSSAFWGFVRVLEEMQDRKPPIVLLENVTGFLTSHNGEDFKAALVTLNQLGYSVDALILDASRFVPQSRQRLFVIGVLDHPTLSAQTQIMFALLAESDTRPKALTKFINDHPEISWRIRALPVQPQRTKRLEGILEDLPDTAPEWWSQERAQYLLNQMNVRHREIAEKMIQGNDWSYGTVFRRMRGGKSTGELRTDGVAGCLRTPRGGSGRQILFKAGKGKYFARLITPREAARLMGADDFQMSVPLNQALFGFGDAVCVPVMEWIATYYLNPVASELIRGRALSANL
jgi:DNA (cytosine-5)-methyltransferase 1